MNEKEKTKLDKIFICDSLIHNFNIATEKLSRWHYRKISNDRFIIGSNKNEIEGIIASILVLINMMQEMGLVDAKAIMDEVSKRDPDCHNAYNSFISKFEDSLDFENNGVDNNG